MTLAPLLLLVLVGLIIREGLFWSEVHRARKATLSNLLSLVW